jgi:hypothetical protein
MQTLNTTLKPDVGKTMKLLKKKNSFMDTFVLMAAVTWFATVMLTLFV